MIQWGNIDQTLTTSFHTLIITKVLFLKCFSAKHWIFLLIQWWLVDDSLRKHLRNSNDFDANNIDRYRFFCAFSRKIDDALLLLYSLMVPWNNFHETLTTSFQILMSTNVLVFLVLICETLIFHCCFSDVLLMLLWGNLDETAMIW